ncbi:MAG: BatA domain-containing protein [Bacteroidales bacterium]|nr:BatA domain-containing protein [Bacteroidales bacterium]
MSFLNLMFLWAGIAIFIPLIIHLFNFRKYKTIYFSDVRFLENVRQISKRKSTIKQILLLIMRILAIACLVIAFAQPIINNKNNEKQLFQAPPIIYIDNSFSMQTGENPGGLIEIAKNKALEIVDAFPKQTKFQLITNDFLQKHTRLVNSLVFRDFVQEIETSPNVKTLSSVIEKAIQNLELNDINNNTKKTIFLISDFQENICDFNSLPKDSLLEIYIVPIQSKSSNNIAIDTCIFNTPFRRIGAQEDITVFLRNYGTEKVNNITLNLNINGEQKSTQSLSLGPGERKDVNIKYINTQANNINGTLSINDSPIKFDNNLYFSYPLDSLINILLIGDTENNKYFKALFENDNNFDITICDEKQSTNQDFKNYKTIILNQQNSISPKLSSELQSYVSLGGNLIFIPSFKGNIQEYNYLLSSLQCNNILSKDTNKCEISTINISSPILQGAIKSIEENTEMPIITKHFNSMTNSYLNEEIILETNTYKKIYTSNKYHQGQVFVFYCPLNTNSGNLVTHRLFVPLIYNSASVGTIETQIYSTIGQNSGIQQKIEEITDRTKFSIKSKSSEYEFIPQISHSETNQKYTIFIKNEINEDGFYDFTVNQKPLRTLAFNYNREESKLTYIPTDEILQKISNILLLNVKIIETNGTNFAYEIMENSTSEPLWKHFLILSIIFMIGEILVLKIL